MTGAAFDGLVSINETIARQVVIESLTIELHHVGVAAFVLGMASPTFAIQGVCLSSMETSMRLAIGCNFLVAV